MERKGPFLCLHVFMSMCLGVGGEGGSTFL